MLTLTFLGVGSAFAKRNYNSNALLEAWTEGPDRQDAPDDNLLIDFGVTGPLALHELKSCDGFSYLDADGLINYPAIRRILITHLHADHIGGLEEFALASRYLFADSPTGKTSKTQIVGASDVLEPLWEHALKGGLGALPDRTARLSDYFSVKAINPSERGDPDPVFLLDQYGVRLFRTHHVQIKKKFDWPSYGLVMTDRRTGRHAVFSGDARFDQADLEERFGEADIIFQDVQLEESAIAVHATLSELRSLPEQLRRRLILYHYGDSWDGGRYDFVPKEFAGFAEPMRRYKLFDRTRGK